MVKKKINKKFDIVFRIIGIIILLLFVFVLIMAYNGIINDTLTLIVFGSMVVYAVIGAIILLPSRLIKFFKKIKKR